MSLPGLSSWLKRPTNSDATESASVAFVNVCVASDTELYGYKNFDFVSR